MATDVQPFFGGFPTPGQVPVVETRDRYQATQSPGPSHEFSSMLGRAEARQATPTRESGPSAPASKNGVQSHSQTRSKPESQTQECDRSKDAAPQEQRISRKDHAAEGKDEPSREKSEDDEQEAEDHRDDQSTPVNDAMVVAMNVPLSTAPVQTAPLHASPEADTQPADDAAKSATAVSDAMTDTATSGASTANASMPAGEQVNTAAVPTAPNVPSDQVNSTASQPKSEEVPSTPQDPATKKEQLTAADTQTTPVEAPAVTEQPEADKLKQAVAAMTVVKHEGRAPLQVATNDGDRASLIDALAQRPAISSPQGTTGAQQQLAQDSGRFSDSAGDPNQSPATVVPTGDANNRTLFLDRMNGQSQPVSPMSDGTSGRNESGQSAAVSRASDIDRLGEFRGTTPFTQSVTLDLDPLDMGPLRVRVMMNDQTVHAHIRTEHGELGQGLLQQGQSLESSLRTTGLEMGMLRVTVDQQQARGDNAWMFQQQQQQQGRPSASSMSQTVAREDERGAKSERGVGSNERVSFFA